jgi:cell division septum initiation protein DivIVA
MSPLDEARALVGGDGPAAERVAAVVAERDDLRTRLAAYESATVEASAETLAALRQVDCVAAGNGETLLMSEARAIRDHLRWLTTRYQREHVGRERAEMQRDVARTERDVLEMQLAARDAVLERIERALGETCTGHLAADVERLVADAIHWRERHAALGEIKRAVDAELADATAPDSVGDAWEYTEGASLHRGPFVVESVEGDGVTRPVQIRMSGIVGARIPAMMRASGWRRVIIAAARERETEPAQAVDPLTCGACRDYGHTTPCIGCVERAEQPRAELGETDAGEGE